jgi:hypothetical protein
MRRHFSVIASAAKQSMSRHKEKDGLLRCARNDVDTTAAYWTSRMPGRDVLFSHGAGSLHWTRHEDAELHKNNRRQYLGN